MDRRLDDHPGVTSEAGFVMEYRIEWHEPMDKYDWAIQEAKGWLNVTVTWGAGRRIVEVYDPV
ncbi:hypothetical protein [Streptomyces sp. NPDC055097]